MAHVVCGNLNIGSSATYTPASGSVISFGGGTDSILTNNSSGSAFHILRVDKLNPANTLSLNRQIRINPGGALQITRGTLFTNGQLVSNQGGTTIASGAILSMNAVRSWRPVTIRRFPSAVAVCWSATGPRSIT